MPHIEESACGFDDAADWSWAPASLFPGAYFRAEPMAQLALDVRERQQAAFCTVPFCHTVECEALGGTVRQGTADRLPRMGAPVCETLERVMDLPPMGSERMEAVLSACRMLHGQGQRVALSVCGPLTILSGLVDTQAVLKALRKQPDLMTQILKRLQRELLHYLAGAKACGVDLICYADPLGSVSILGPQLTDWITDTFTCSFLGEAVALADRRMLLALCPRTAFALTRAGRAISHPFPFPGPITYGEACVELIGRADLVGQQCLRRAGRPLGQSTVQLLELVTSPNRSGPKEEDFPCRTS